jgi:hypothetical protein
VYPAGLRLHFNPIRSREWLHFAVTDAAMLQAMLYGGAVYLALLEGKTESWDMMYHQHQTVSILNKRLCDSTLHIADSTISAISCLALGEVGCYSANFYKMADNSISQAITGNPNKWHIHMRGIQQMLRKRGGTSSLDPLIQVKLQR